MAALSTTALAEQIIQAAKTKQTPLSLQTLLNFGREGLVADKPSPKQLIIAAQFLKRELPIRLSHRIVELDNLPHSECGGVGLCL